MKRFEGKRAIITGGGSGIGRAAAERLLQEGARVVICSRDIEKLEHTAQTIGHRESVFPLRADVRDEADVANLVAEAVAWLGGLDVLVHSAGIDGAGSEVLGLTLGGWERVVSANLTGAFLVCRAAAAVMTANGGGSITVVASLNGVSAEAGFADYNASKAGVILLAQTMALELVTKGIRVNTVCPGYVLTPMTEGYAADPAVLESIRMAVPMARFGRPAEVAAAIAFLASDDASYVTGHHLIVDGGRHARQ